LRAAVSRYAPRVKKTAAPTVSIVVAELKKLASKRMRDGMLRFGIPNGNALGIEMNKIQSLAKRVGRSHELAEELWQTNIYEARILASFVAEPERVTPAEMDRWCRDFDSWAVCDTVCFKLWDRTPHAFARIDAWAKAKQEFVKRASFALLASVALHDKKIGDAEFAKRFALIERASDDERNFVKKGVSWALRSVGRRSPALRKESLALAKLLSESTDATKRWIGKDALRDLSRRKS
jgi:3-methyladenine DNA glycosylase AlkD